MRYFPVSNFCLLYYPGMCKRNSSKSGCSHLQEVPNIVISLQNIWYFAKLVPEEKWSQGLTVQNTQQDVIMQVMSSHI